MRIRVRALEPGMICFDDISGEELVVKHVRPGWTITSRFVDFTNGRFSCLPNNKFVEIKEQVCKKSKNQK